jgi:hypothetical protein
VEIPKEFASFEFTALWNTFAGMANSIRDRGRAMPESW